MGGTLAARRRCSKLCISLSRESEMISFFCPYCKHVQKALEEQGGTSTVCEKCKLEVRVPKPAEPPSLPSSSVEQQKPAPLWKRLFATTR